MDGVLARGTNPIPEAKKAIEMIKDSEGNLTKPVAFVTNACNRSADKAKQISKWFDIKVSYFSNVIQYYVFWIIQSSIGNLKNWI